MSALLLALLLQAADYAELEATLLVPLQARSQARSFRVQLSVPGPGPVRWRVDLLNPAGRSVLQWRGKAVRENAEQARASALLPGRPGAGTRSRGRA